MARKAVLGFLLLLLFPGLVLAQTYKINEIAIEGNHRVDQGAIRAVVSAQPGEVGQEAIDRDLHAIFRLGKFHDVSAEIEKRDGVSVLVYRVAEQPLVRQVEFTGNKELSDEKLRGLLTFKPPEIYNPQQVEATVAAIRKAYLEEGYYAATAAPEMAVKGENEGTLTFHVKEGEKVLVRNIRFNGNEVFTDKQLRKVMETKERWIFSWLTSRGTYNEQVLQNDLEIVADQYYNKGYVQVKVHQPQISLSEDKKSMDILIDIDEGKQFRVGDVGVQGDLLKGREEILALVKLHQGDIFDRQLLRESILAINDLYADRGYAYVNVSPLTRVNPEKLTVNLMLDIEQGTLVTIDRIRINGNTKTRDKVIRREMPIVEGDLYSASQLKESRRKINNLGFFDEVNVATSKGVDESHMDVKVDVKERPTGTFSVGAGYSSVDGVIGQASVSQTNFLGRALKLNLATSLGSRTTTYQLGLTDPWFLDHDLTLGFDLYKTDRDWIDFTKKSLGGDLKLGFPVTEKTRAFFLYRYEEKKILDVDESASLFIREQEGSSTLSSISSTLTRDTTDYRLDPTRGSVASATVEVAGLGGTEKFVQGNLDYRHFFPLKWGTVFSAHGHLGYIRGIGGEDIPIDERFFLGGLNTMRGFKSRELGPRIRVRKDVVDPATGAVTSSEDFEFIGGNKEAYFNLEYTFPLLKELNLKGLFFFDTGNAWGEGEEYFSDLRYSVGGGIRWFSPLGPLRLEWGYNLDPREGEPHSAFDFSIGSFF